MKQGVLYAIGAHTAWGFLLIYWKLLKDIPALQLIAHRVVWSFILLLIFVLLSTQRKRFFGLLSDPKILRTYLAAALLIGLNWLVYVWAVISGFVVEASLGYFINPLISVFLGMLFFRERLRPLQWVPITLAASGVIYLTLNYGRLPWIALTLAFTFGFYGVVKKSAPLNSLQGLTIETGILFLPALGLLIFSESTGSGAFLHSGFPSDPLMVCAGIATVVPLLLFSAAAKRVPLSLIGFSQYIAPTLQLLLGVTLYKEPFQQPQWIGFGLVWTALAIFTGEGLKHYRENRRLAPTER
jgi:chloramphenicol-sensitive protein RarD